MAVANFIDVTVDVSAVPEKPVGAGRYTLELAHQLSIRGDMRPVLISRKGDEMRWEALPGMARVAAVAPDRRPLRLAWEQIRLPGVLRSLSPDVHHGPHYTLPERSKTPKVVTIHDMTFFDHPEWHEHKKVLFFKKVIAESVKRAEGVIAISHDTGRRLEERFGNIDITVIPHGVDHERFSPARDQETTKRDRALLRRAGIDGDFIAFVGTLEPRKDVVSLVKAFDAVASTVDGLKLVLAGRPGWGVAPIEQALAASPHRDRVVRPGYLPDAAIPALLRQARVVAYPSLVEGFGLPALEALSCGAPLVSTTGSAVEEVVGDAAMLVPPGDVDALAEALDTVLTDGETRARLARRGPEQASAYTWKASADAHVAVYRSIAERHRH